MDEPKKWADTVTPPAREELLKELFWLCGVSGFTDFTKCREGVQVLTKMKIPLIGLEHEGARVLQKFFRECVDVGDIQDFEHRRIITEIFDREKDAILPYLAQFNTHILNAGIEMSLDAISAEEWKERTSLGREIKTLQDLGTRTNIETFARQMLEQNKSPAVG